jgi:hypothetical protein
VKIDVEGAELKVLRGMSEMLLKFRPHLLIEVSRPFLAEVGDSASELFLFLEDLGYRGSSVEWDKLTPVACWTDGLPDQFNAFFTVGEHLPRSLQTGSTPRGEVLRP